MGKKKLKKLMKRAGRMPGMEGGQGAAGMGGGPLAGLAAMRTRDQFLLGALLGAGAAYVLGDEKLRGKLMRAGLRLYSELAANYAEMKEQMADIRAEMAAEDHGTA